VTIVARLVLAIAWSDKIFGCDIKDWRFVALWLLDGENPYTNAKYRLLNWPPMWMEILYGTAKVCVYFKCHIFTGIRLFLTACDVILMGSVYALLHLFDRPNTKALLFGFCLNPFLILLTIQQGNFDVIPAACIVWFIYFLIRFRREQLVIDWLLAAACLGLGGFAKTFPLVLLPLLVIESRKISWKARFLGAALALGPIVLSLLPLYVLYPEDILDGVIHYRGTAGPMGMSGLIQLFYGLPAVARYSPYFTDGLIAAMGLVTSIFWFRPLKNDLQIVLLASVILLGISVFGSGYCPQYWMWVWPLGLLVYANSSAGFRRVLLICAVIVVLTNILIFAYNTDNGSFMPIAFPGPFNERLRDWFLLARNNVLVCLPMTVAAFVMWAGMAWRLFTVKSR
jgi:hypothetical protein